SDGRGRFKGQLTASEPRTQKLKPSAAASKWLRYYFLVGRRRYIDWARGIAVLIMIQAHTADAWTRMADRSSHAYGYVLILAGFAAPLFLWLAGLGLVLSAERTQKKTG